MAADDRTDQADHDLLRIAADHLHQLLLDKQRVLLAVAMADEDLLVLRALQLGHLLHQRLERLMAAAHLAARDQLALRVHMQHRLDAEHGAKERCGRRAPAAALQKVQIDRLYKLGQDVRILYGMDAVERFLQQIREDQK